ncbi:AbrB/MazE/SpoVT family DNA-binding domain-containing protein [Enterococcus sp. N249-2]
MQLEEKKIRKVGNSVVITIPQEFLDQANIQPGEVVSVDNEVWGKLIMKKEKSREEKIAMYAKKSMEKYDKAYRELVSR